MKPKAKTVAIALMIVSLIFISASAAFASIQISKSVLQNAQMQKIAANIPHVDSIPLEEAYTDELALEKMYMKEDEAKTETPAPVTMTKEVRINMFKAFIQKYLGSRVRIPPGGNPAYPIELSPADRANPLFESVDMAKYSRFQHDNQGIFREMAWQSSSGTTSIIYSQQKMQALAHYAALLESGQQFPFSAPPEGTFLNITGHITRLYTEEEALQMYLPHIAMALYIEVNHLVPWSILGYNKYQRSLLLDGRKFINYDSPKNGYRFYINYENGGGYQGVTDWDPFASYLFLQDNSMIQPTQRETIYTLTEWMRANLVHEALADQFRNREMYGYPGYYPVDKILNPPAGARHWTQGCSGTTGLYKALLHTANIPVSNNFTIGGHRSPVFVTADLSMGHADDVYSTYNKRAPQEVPVENIFMTIDEFDDMNHASPDDSRRPNNADMAGWLNQKRNAENAYGFRAYGLLEKRGFDVLYPHLSAATLQEWWTEGYHSPLFEEGAMNEMIASIDAEITRIGEGNYSEGHREINREIVRAP